jgi:serine/threonine-protein kinase
MAAVMGLGAWFFLNPERQAEAIEAALARGDSVVLIGKTGAPRWFHWRKGEESSKVRLNEDGTFHVETLWKALVELVRDPKQMSFKFRAEVRHERGHAPCWVGLFVLHQEQTTSRGRVHFFGGLGFDDVTDPIEQDKIQRDAGRVPPNHHSTDPVAHFRSFFVPAPRQDEDSTIASGGLESRSFHPAGTSKADWRKLEVYVTPGGVRPTWEGKKLGHFTAGRFVEDGQFTAGQFVADAELARATQRVLQPDDYATEVQPSYFVRGSLGLCLVGGAASFRNVVIEPSTDPH